MSKALGTTVEQDCNAGSFLGQWFMFSGTFGSTPVAVYIAIQNKVTIYNNFTIGLDI